MAPRARLIVQGEIPLTRYADNLSEHLTASLTASQTTQVHACFTKAANLAVPLPSRLHSRDYRNSPNPLPANILQRFLVSDSPIGTGFAFYTPAAFCLPSVALDCYTPLRVVI